MLDPLALQAEQQAEAEGGREAQRDLEIEQGRPSARRAGRDPTGRAARDPR
jgi:hypothetical protein